MDKEQPINIEELLNTGSVRRSLPMTRAAVTFKTMITQWDVYMTVGFYEDWRVGEVFVCVGKVGHTLREAINSWARAVSLLLQAGEPLEIVIQKFSETNFEPQGFTTDEEINNAKSIIDWVSKKLRRYADPLKNDLRFSKMEYLIHKGESQRAGQGGPAGEGRNESRFSDGEQGRAVQQGKAGIESMPYSKKPCAVCERMMRLPKGGICSRCQRILHEQADVEYIKKIKSNRPGNSSVGEVPVEKYNEMWVAYQERQTITQVAKSVDGIGKDAAKKYIERGDPKRGLRPLRARFIEVQQRAQKKADYTAADARRESLIIARRYEQQIGMHLKDREYIIEKKDKATGKKKKEVRLKKKTEFPKTLSSEIDKTARLKQFLLGEEDSRIKIVDEFDGYTDEELEHYIKTGEEPLRFKTKTKTEGDTD